MPTYVYACDTCGAQFEKFQSFKDEPVRECPRCEASVRRVFQPVGIVFKGAGWYITDSRKSESATVKADGAKAETTSDTADSKPETKSDAKPETKTDAKPETKTDAKPETKSETTSTSAAKPATA